MNFLFHYFSIDIYLVSVVISFKFKDEENMKLKEDCFPATMTRNHEVFLYVYIALGKKTRSRSTDYCHRVEVCLAGLKPSKIFIK